MQEVSNLAKVALQLARWAPNPQSLSYQSILWC